ncbi:glycosyltransferase family 1 protein [Candidatus Bathyarchaeota archaeon]|nr:MAG: glycosyltransferase family 1 protein [Candidatus Bathyarchaeota archaeon]
MRVAFVHSLMGQLLGGGERLIEELGRRLEEMGYEVAYVTLNFNPHLLYAPISLDKIFCINFKLLKLGFLKAYLWNLLALLSSIKCLKHFNPHIFFLSTNHSIGWILKRIFGRRIVIYVHWPEFLHRRRSGVLRRIYFALIDLLESMSFRIADAILANSHYTARALRYTVGNIKVDVAYPGVDVEEFMPEAKEELILTVSRITQAKNLEFVIRVASIVVKTHPSAKFIIAGFLHESDKPYFTRLLNLVKELGLDKNLSIIPNIPDEELKRLYGKASIVLYPRIGEHFGIALIEGMSAGAVCIAADKGGPQEIIENGVTGYRLAVVEDSWAEKILELLKNPTKLKSMGEKARRITVSKFSWSALANRVHGKLVEAFTNK